MRSRDLNGLVARSRLFIRRWRLWRELRVASSKALAWLFVGPAVMLIVQELCALNGKHMPVTLWLLVLSSAAVPILYVLSRMAMTWRSCRPDRSVGLALFDAQLSSQERIVTADEFLGGQAVTHGSSGAFVQAAIQDGERYVQKAMQADLNALPMPGWTLHPSSVFGVIAAMVISFILMFWNMENPADRTAISHGRGSGNAQDEALTVSEDPSRVKAFRDSRRMSREERDVETLLPQEPVSSVQKSSAREEAAQGQANASSASAAESSSDSSSAAGQPAGEKNASKPKPDEQSKAEPASQDKKRKNVDPPPQKNMRLAMDSTSGQGKSSGSNSSIGQFDSPEQQDKSNPGNKQEAEGEDSEDEDEEQKSNSATKPDLNDRKAPVDRNMLPAATTQGNPNKWANGRTGPSARKKTRGVPSMILGIPVPDRVQGKPNSGRSKVTQENAKPAVENHRGLEAQVRLGRTQMTGEVERVPLLPWMQKLVRTYFINVNGQSGPD